MSTSVPPIAPEVVTNLRQGDEHALEQVFHDQYISLTEKAAAVLGDGYSAARTVEGVFTHAWRDRETFQTPDDLQLYLNGHVHDGAVHRLSRRAVLHHDGAPKKAAHADAPPVDEAWAQVHAALHVSAADAAAAAHQMTDHSRHATATHVADIAKQPSWIIPVVGAVVLAGAVWGAVRWGDRASAETAISSLIDAPDAHLSQSGSGQIGDVTLTDGTKLHIAPESKIRVPSRFGTTVRALGIDGAGTFTVAPGKSLPFQVRARNAMITATGTIFSVRDYPADDAVMVRVKEGEVTVKAGTETRAVSAGKTIAVAKDGVISEPSAAAAEEALGWSDGTIAVNDRPLRDALTQVKRWYGLSIFLRDSTLGSRKVTMKAPLESSRDAIAAIEQSAGVKFGYEGRVMVLRDTLGAAKTTSARKK